MAPMNQHACPSCPYQRNSGQPQSRGNHQEQQLRQTLLLFQRGGGGADVRLVSCKNAEDHDQQKESPVYSGNTTVRYTLTCLSCR